MSEIEPMNASEQRKQLFKMCMRTTKVADQAETRWVSDDGLGRQLRRKSLHGQRVFDDLPEFVKNRT